MFQPFDPDIDKNTMNKTGCVTFVTMAYILAVNASIISDTGGPCKLPSEYAEGEVWEPEFFDWYLLFL